MQIPWRARALHQRHRRLLWIGVALVALWLDYVTGPFIQFPILFVLPTALAAWRGERGLALVLAALLPLGRLAYDRVWGLPVPISASVANYCIRVAVLVLVAVLVARTARQAELQQRKLRVLAGLLPMCAFCKRIRDEHGDWHPLERYIESRSEAEFSHGVCPSCGEQHYGEFAR